MTRARAQRLTVDERRAQLIELGLSLFSQRAYDELSTDEIASMAGVSKGLLYHYFDSKRGYYVETIREVAKRIEAVTEPEEGLALPDALRGALERFLDFVDHNAAIYRALMRGGIGADAEVQTVVEGVRQTSVQRVLERAQIREPSSRLRTLVYGWVGFTEAVSLDWVDQGRKLPRAEVLELMWLGFGPVLGEVARSMNDSKD